MSAKTRLNIFESNVLMTLKQIAEQKEKELENLLMFDEVEYDYILKKLIFHKDELKQELSLFTTVIDSILSGKYGK